jgi:hypothetical protein
MIQDCLSQLQLLRPARRLPQGRCHFAEQLEHRTLWYRRATAVCVRTLANAGASAKCNEAVVAQAATPGIGAVLDEAADHSFKAWAIFEGEMLSKSWNGMLETIMTGKTAA